MPFDSDTFALASGLTFTAKNDAQINFTGSFGNYLIDEGSTLDIQSGADFSAPSGKINIGSGGGDGTLVVDGAGSSVTIGSLSSWGASGDTADVTFRMESTGNLGDIHLALSSLAGTTGIFNVESAATVTTGGLLVATLGGITTIGTINVDGAGSSLTQTGASIVDLGHTSEGTATINVQNSGTFNTGTGTTTVNATGTVNVGVVGSGTFNANGNVNVDGGTIMRGSGGFNLASGFALTATNDAQIHFVGAYDIDQGTTLDIQSGADFSTTSSLDIGDGGGDGTLIVDGAGSSVTTGSGISFEFWGDAGNTANVTFRNGATGILGGIRLASSATGGTTGIFNIESGATVTTDFLFVTTSGGATTSGAITVDGGSSSLTQNGSFSLIVGHATDGTATINVQNGGTFSTGTALTFVDVTGTINVGAVGSGTFNVNSPMTIDGEVNLIEGQINAGMVTLNGGGAFNFTGGTLTVDTFVGNLTQDGGTLAPGASPGTTIITNDYVMNAGTLAIELGGLTAGTDFDQLVVAGNVTLGGMLDVSLISPFTPSLGQSFEIVDVGGSLTGTFSGLSQDAVVGNFGGTDLFINYAGGDGNDVTLLATLAGDFDLDLDVDGTDFLKWQRGESPNPLSALDLAAWEANYGMVAPVSATATAVPEPSAILLGAMASLVGLSFRRRR